MVSVFQKLDLGIKRALGIIGFHGKGIGPGDAAGEQQCDKNQSHGMGSSGRVGKSFLKSVDHRDLLPDCCRFVGECRDFVVKFYKPLKGDCVLGKW